MDKQLCRVVSVEDVEVDNDKTPLAYVNDYCVGVLVPVEPVHDLAWAWEKMREPGTSMYHALGEYRIRGTVLMKWDCGSWSQAYMIKDLLDGWSEERIEKSPTPGTLEWARGIVRDGGAVWIDNAPWTKHANYRFYHQNGSSFWNPCEEWGRETGWHLWGDREWLMALPDGTRVDHERIGQDARRTKYGNDLIGKNGHRYPINCVVDSGWDLVREPVKAIPTPILDQDDDDDTLADLVRRVEALERKAGNP